MENSINSTNLKEEGNSERSKEIWRNLITASFGENIYIQE
jgi:hypothetical protein